MSISDMVVSSRAPDGWPEKCPICGNNLQIEPSSNTQDATCPHCGTLLWFFQSGGVAPILDILSLPDELVPVDLPNDMEIPPCALELIPESVARENQVLPLAELPAGLVVAVTDPMDIETLEKLQFILNRGLRTVYVTRSWIKTQIRKLYGEGSSGRDPE